MQSCTRHLYLQADVIEQIKRQGYWQEMLKRSFFISGDDVENKNRELVSIFLRVKPFLACNIQILICYSGSW